MIAHLTTASNIDLLSPREQLEIFERYLMMKIQQRDWHGVADAAMDIRELVARNPELA